MSLVALTCELLDVGSAQNYRTKPIVTKLKVVIVILTKQITGAWTIVTWTPWMESARRRVRKNSIYFLFIYDYNNYILPTI